MELNNLLAGVEFTNHIDKNIDITGIAYDSRKVKPGNIFIAIEGFKVDGHNYILKAKEKGAIVIVVEKEGYEDTNTIKVKSSRLALSIISKNFYNNPTDKMMLIGITGTNGKTSITYIIRDMLLVLNKKIGVIGTIRNLIGDVEYKTSVTTPESLELNELFQKMVENSTDISVMETSSHALSQYRVDGLNFDVGVFTNLTQDHLDYHKSMEEYFIAKCKLFELAKYSLINIDDGYGEKIYDKFKNKSFSYGIYNDADFYAKDIKFSTDGTKFTLIYKNNEYKIETEFFGDIYVYNTLAAIGSLCILGIDIDDVIAAVKGIKPVKGRLEMVPNNFGINVFIDYAHTPDALENVLKICRDFKKNRLISVFGCGGDRDKSKRPKMGGISVKIADYSIITSDNPRSEDPKLIIEDIIKGIPMNSNKYIVEIDREKAIEKSIEIAVSGDTIIIAGKGHETYQIIGNETIEFSDCFIARKYLERKIK